MVVGEVVEVVVEVKGKRTSLEGGVSLRWPSYVVL